MRKRTEKEREVIGKVEAIFRNLDIDRNIVGYAPLLDITVYAYAFPKETFSKIMTDLSKQNYYLGVSGASEEIYSEIVHIVKYTVERADNDYLAHLGLDKLQVILKGKRNEELERELIASIGESYSEYSNDEKIVFFFIKRILDELKKGA